MLYIYSYITKLLIVEKIKESYIDNNKSIFILITFVNSIYFKYFKIF